MTTSSKVTFTNPVTGESRVGYTFTPTPNLRYGRAYTGTIEDNISELSTLPNKAREELVNEITRRVDYDIIRSLMADIKETLRSGEYDAVMSKVERERDDYQRAMSVVKGNTLG